MHELEIMKTKHNGIEHTDRFFLDNEYLVKFKNGALSLTKVLIEKNGDETLVQTSSPSLHFKCFGSDLINQIISTGVFPTEHDFEGIGIGIVHLNHGYDVAASGLMYRKMETVKLVASMIDCKLCISISIMSGKKYLEDDVINSSPKLMNIGFLVSPADISELLSHN